MAQRAVSPVRVRFPAPPDRRGTADREQRQHQATDLCPFAATSTTPGCPLWPVDVPLRGQWASEHCDDADAPTANTMVRRGFHRACRDLAGGFSPGSYRPQCRFRCCAVKTSARITGDGRNGGKELDDPHRADRR
ncbi:hypothetical protein GCM10010185_46430 [Saccharothrix coeruleofusca]|uniref:Uncharacterized protein n=1 Tax=Saccharothrix coeruleofusca TaxID=33919 RepID=A0A918EGF0_9PSEU|nr:hypothetical protein GCM10010185_46430 [Saccharothrix coeruleofusca]